VPGATSAPRMGVKMNKKQKEGYALLHKRMLAAAEQGNLNETLTLLHTIKTDFPGEINQGFDLFLADHLWLPLTLLMDAGADCGPNDRYQRAQYVALGVAAKGGHIALVQAILALGLDPTSKAMFTLGLRPAIMGGDVAVVELLLDYGIDINTRYPRLMTALELGILRDAGMSKDVPDNRNDMTKFLLAHGAVCTPFALAEAAAYGRLEALRLLLAQGCDVNAPTNMNLFPGHYRSRYKTPLEVARKECPPPCRSAVIQILLDAGATN